MENVLPTLRTSALINKLERREFLTVVGLTGFGCLLRIVLIPYGGFITNDGVYYATLGRYFVAGDIQHGMSTYWAPLYPLLIGIVDTVVNDAVHSGRLVSALAGGLLVIPVYFLAQRVTGSRAAALVSAIFVIFEPTLISYSLKVLTESVYTLLFMTGILVGWIALENRKGFQFFLCGILFGLAYLVKPEAIGYVLLLSLIVIVVGFIRVTGARWVASSAALICLGALLAAAPYLLYLRSVSGSWMLSKKFGDDLPGSVTRPRKLLPDGQLTNADIVWGGTKPEASSAPGVEVPAVKITPPQSPTGSVSMPTLVNKLRERVKRTFRGLHDEYGMIGELLPPLLLLLIGVGLFARPWGADRIGSELYFSAFIFSTFLGYAFAQQELRYLVPLIPLTLCWAAIGSLRSASWLDATFARFSQMRSLRFRLGPTRARVVVISAVVLSFSLNSILSMRHDVWDPSPVANWIRAQGLQSPLIMSTGPWPAFYAGGRHLYIPNEELPVVLAYAKRKKVDFLLLERRSLDRTPNLATLLEGSSPPEVTRVFEYGSENDRLVVYRLNQDSPQISGTPKLSTQSNF